MGIVWRAKSLLSPVPSIADTAPAQIIRLQHQSAAAQRMFRLTLGNRARERDEHNRPSRHNHIHHIQVLQITLSSSSAGTKEGVKGGR